MLEAPGSAPLASVAPPADAVLLLVGPAGGWEPTEKERLALAGFASAGLGPRTMRSETAAVAAVAAAQVLWGDMRS
jgi:16S rRNA (uracil1498-N3)-methyltransferase